MNQRISTRSIFLAAIISGTTFLPGVVRATVVEFQTVMGNFEVNLYDNGTPQTVANFLGYVNSGAYANSIVHRSDSNFIIQGGGFDNNFNGITANAPVVNEPEFANHRGTIANAKLAGDANSATKKRFIKIADNTGALDGQNGGFTVFGEVVGDGMDVVDAIAALPTFPFQVPFSEIPLTNYTNTDFNNNVAVDDTHLIIISAVVITDATVDSAAGLNPAPNTSANPPPVPPPVLGGGGGGSFGFAGLLALLILYRRRTV